MLYADYLDYWMKEYFKNIKNNIGHIYTKEEIKIILDRFKNNNLF